MRGVKGLAAAARLAYPFLLGVVPVLHVAAKNVLTVGAGQIVAPLLVALGTVAALLGALRLATGSYARAAVAAATLLLLSVLGGGAYGAVADAVIGLPRPAVFAAGLALALGLALGFATWLFRSPLRIARATTILATAGATLFVSTLVQLAEPHRLAIFLRSAHATPAPPERTRPPLTEDSAATRDIYYIVADAYARHDALQRVYGYDNREFLDWLRARGFYVAGRSWANYATTFMSLASSLSMDYLDDLSQRGTGPLDRRPFYARIQAPRVARALQGKGYRYVQVLTNWGGTDHSEIADRTWKLAPFLGDEFATTIANMTLLRALAPDISALHRFVAETTPTIADIPGPTFAFVHLLLPHHPFVFDERGAVVANYPLAMDFKLQKDAWRERDAYVRQLRYTNELLKGMIGGILERSPVPPIIILQGDHGTGYTAFAGGSKGGSADPRERLAILNAYLVPPGVRERLYDSISPVNSFRVVLSAQFGDDYPVLPDVNYYSSYNEGIADFRDVTDQLRAGTP
jgi:hypothetical protein